MNHKLSEQHWRYSGNQWEHMGNPAPRRRGPPELESSINDGEAALFLSERRVAEISQRFCILRRGGNLADRLGLSMACRVVSAFSIISSLWLSRTRKVNEVTLRCHPFRRPELRGPVPWQPPSCNRGAGPPGFMLNQIGGGLLDHGCRERSAVLLMDRGRLPGDDGHLIVAGTMNEGLLHLLLRSVTGKPPMRGGGSVSNGLCLVKFSPPLIQVGCRRR